MFSKTQANCWVMSENAIIIVYMCDECFLIAITRRYLNHFVNNACVFRTTVYQLYMILASWITNRHTNWAKNEERNTSAFTYAPYFPVDIKKAHLNKIITIKLNKMKKSLEWFLAVSDILYSFHVTWNNSFESSPCFVVFICVFNTETIIEFMPTQA